jgi:hypothetical protein
MYLAGYISMPLVTNVISGLVVFFFVLAGVAVTTHIFPEHF